MSYLLDTNVIGELRKPAGRAAPQVRRWAQRRSTSELYISVITVLEIEVGVGRMERRDPAQGEVLRRWFERDLLAAFEGRVLAIDEPVASRAAAMHVPDPRPERDAMIAATALVRNQVVVTRNVDDFAPLGVTLLDPWQS